MKILRTFLALAILGSVYFFVYKIFNMSLPWNEAMAFSVTISPVLIISLVSLLDFFVFKKIEKREERNTMPKSNLTMQSPVTHLIVRASEFGIEITPAGAEEILKNNYITKDPFFLSRKEIENLCNQLLI